MSREIALMPATELLRRYRDRSLSPVEATKAALARIEALNGKLNAYCLVDAEGALKTARDAEARWQKGAPIGPLDGVPSSIKDLILTTGWSTRTPTSSGCRRSAHRT